MLRDSFEVLSVMTGEALTVVIIVSACAYEHLRVSTRRAAEVGLRAAPRCLFGMSPWS